MCKISHLQLGRECNCHFDYDMGKQYVPLQQSISEFRWSIECTVLAAAALLELSGSGTGHWLGQRLPRNPVHADLSSMMKEKQNINNIFNCKAINCNA